MEHTDLLEIYNDVFCLYSSEKNESTIESFERFLEKGILKMVYSILKKISSPSEKNSSFAFSVNYYSDNFKGERFSIKIEDKEIKTFVFKDDLKLFISNNLFENFVAEDDKINVLNTFYQDYSSKITFSLKDYFAEDNNKCIKLISFEQNNKKKKIEVTIYKNNCESSKQEDNIQFILNDISTFINNFSINGKTEDKYYKPYFDYLTNNLKDQKLNQYAFSFVNKITGKNLGNLVITTCNKIKLKKLILIHFIVEYILSRIAETDNNLSLKNANIKSAIAAIMSRNMSHNLGSHVFYYTRQNILDIYETEKDDSSFKYTKEIKGLSWFLHYVQERQDFVANINSGDSYIFGPLNLKQDVIDEIAPDALDERHLDGNKANKITKNYLLENIVRSEKISRHSSENKSLADIQIEIKFNGKKFSTEKDTKVENEFYNLDFAVQGGQQSRHAFLIMLENIIRNSAKHAFNKSESNNLTITIDVERLNNGYKISIYDNTKNADVALDTLKWSLESLKYIDENTNTIDRNNKGLKEILVSVLWLKGLEFGKIEEYAKDPEILNIENIEGNIAFTFTVPVFENEKSLSIEHISKILNNESLDIYATIFNVNEIIIKQYIEKYLKFNIRIFPLLRM